MELVLTTALLIHVISGFAALGTGLSALIAPKGKRLHVLSGRIFYYLMLSVAITAVVVSTVKLNLFLLLIAGFAFYQNVSGYRSVRNKAIRPRATDWFVTGVGLLTAISMILTLNTILLVFGGISLFLVGSDIRTYSLVLKGKPVPRLAWLSRHIGMMMGSYIATVTAFVVVNVQHIEPEWIPWLLPTVVGVPLMQYWTWKYTRRKQPVNVPATEKQH